MISLDLDIKWTKRYGMNLDELAFQIIQNPVADFLAILCHAVAAGLRKPTIVYINSNGDE
jgi:hypothetical protein